MKAATIKRILATPTLWAAAMLTANASAQEAGYLALERWAQLPQGRQWGQVVAVDNDTEGNVYVLDRCGAESCVDRTEAPLLKFDASGRLVKSWGEGIFVWPHGLHVDHEGFVWATDARAQGGRGHQVFKFDPDGVLLMTLGTAGVGGEGENELNGPADVVVSPEGFVFVADGHGNNRIVKFTSAGRFVTAWGRRGSRPGELDVPHSISLDPLGRLLVADRDNARIQVFDQNGDFIEEWTQFGSPSGVYVDRRGILYVAHAQGIIIADAVNGTVSGSISHTSAGAVEGNIEDVTADYAGNVYAALADPRTLRKLARP